MKDNKYWVFPTQVANLHKYFDMLMDIEEIRQNQFIYGRREIAEIYSKQYVKNCSSIREHRSPKTCIRYFGVLTKLGVLKKSDLLELSGQGARALRHYSKYRRTGCKESLKAFNNIMYLLLCSDYKIKVQGEIVRPFAIISYFMSVMEGRIYDHELLLLMLMRNLQDVEEIIEICKQYRRGEIKEGDIIGVVKKLQMDKGITDEELDHICLKLLGIPKAMFSSVGAIRDKIYDRGSKTNREQRLNFTSSIKFDI